VNDQICFKKHAVGLLVVDFVRNGVKDHVSTARLRNHRGASHTLARQLMTEATRDLFFQLLVRSDLWYGLLRHNALISDHIQGLYCCGSLINLRVALKTMMSGRGRSFPASIIRISIYIIWIWQHLRLLMAHPTHLMLIWLDEITTHLMRLVKINKIGLVLGLSKSEGLKASSHCGCTRVSQLVRTLPMNDPFRARNAVVVEVSAPHIDRSGLIIHSFESSRSGNLLGTIHLLH